MEPKRSVVHQLQKLIFFYPISWISHAFYLFLILFSFFIHWKFCSFAVAFYGSSSRPQLVALVAQVKYCIFKVPLDCCMHEFIIGEQVWFWHQYAIFILILFCHYYSLFCLSFEFLPYSIKQVGDPATKFRSNVKSNEINL
jgi:hypothetical protein